MSREELNQGMAWAREDFTWILPSGETEWAIENILTIASQLCLRRGIRGLVLSCHPL